MGFPTTPNLAPQLDPFPPFGGSKTWKNANNGFYHFQMMKLCEVFRIENFFHGKVVCTYVWKTSVKKLSKSVHNYTFYTDFSAPPRLTKMRYTFKRLYFLNGCIDLDVLYTVRKDMTWSTSRPNLIGKVYHLQGQNIGQTFENSVFGFYYACKCNVM